MKPLSMIHGGKALALAAMLALVSSLPLVQAKANDHGISPRGSGNHIPQGEHDLYASVSGVYAFAPQISGDNVASFHPGGGALIALGRGDPTGLRLEAEIGVRNFEVKRQAGSTLATTLMANAQYAWELPPNLTFGYRVNPYAGLGLGYMQPSPSEASRLTRKGAFAFQIMLGLGFPAGDRGEVRLGLRTTSATRDEYTVVSPELELGYLIRF